jgi:hypothetical protein
MTKGLGDYPCVRKPGSFVSRVFSYSALFAVHPQSHFDEPRARAYVLETGHEARGLARHTGRPDPGGRTTRGENE